MANNMNTAEMGRAILKQKLEEKSNYLILKRKIGRITYLVIEKGPSDEIWLRCKTRKAGTWHSSIHDGKIIAEREDEKYFWAFIDLIGISQPRFFIVPDWWMRTNIYLEHQKFLKQHGGIKPRKPDATHHAIRLKDIEKWEDEWDLII